VYPANWACPAPAIRAVGGFDPDLGLDASLGSRRVGETFDVMDRLSAIGMAAWYLPDARVRHFVPRHKCTLRSVGQNAEAIGRYSARAARPHPFVLRRPELRAWGVKPSGPRAGVPWRLSIRTATLGMRWIAARVGGRPAYAEYVALRFCLGRMKELRAVRRADRFEQAGHPTSSSTSRAAAISHPSAPPPLARREGRACALAFRLGWAFGIRGLRHPSSLYCFFSFSRVGGAERVHADIVQCLAERRPWVVLTGRSRDRRLRRAFARHARVVSVGWWERHALTRAALVGYLTALVNRDPEAIVFGAKSRLFYDLLPGLDPHVRAVDLIHAFGGRTPLEVVSLPVVRRLDCRVTVTHRTRADFEQQYQAQGVERHYAERIRVVTNRVDVPATRPTKARTGPLTVLYVGRSSEEKRAHLAAQVARRCREAALPCVFVFVGDVRRVVTLEQYPECDVRGWLAEPAELAEIYERAHALLLPSSREGFPLVIMEAMANGVVPIATAVGGIREHLRDGVTGWLIETESEADVVRAMTHAVERLLDRALLDQMSAAAYEYARRHFTGVDFCRAYREILGPRGATP
jgi:glycosyltransferase involved in cell wall biosynthesis